MGNHGKNLICELADYTSNTKSSKTRRKDTKLKISLTLVPFPFAHSWAFESSDGDQVVLCVVHSAPKALLASLYKLIIVFREFDFSAVKGKASQPLAKKSASEVNTMMFNVNNIISKSKRNVMSQNEDERL